MKRGTKKTEVGLIPDDWQVINLNKNFTLRARIGWQGLTVSEYLDSGDYILVTGTDFKKGYIDWNSVVFVEKERYVQDPNIQLRAGDILVTKDGTIGKVAFISHLPNPATLNSGVFVIRPTKTGITSQYIYYVLMSFHFNDFLSRITAGSTITHLYQKDFIHFNLPLPPSPEQQAIAEALSDADAWVESLEALIEKKRLIRKGAMQELLRPKDGWELTTLGQVADENKKWSFTGGPFGSNLKSSDYTCDGVRVIQLQNIGDGDFIDDSEVYTSVDKADELVSCNIYPGDIILSKMGDPVARACIIPDKHDRYLMCSDGIRLAVNQRENVSYFICEYINSPFFRIQAENNSSGSTRKRIGLVTLRNLILAIPNWEEQKRIAEILSAMAYEITSLEQKLSKTRQIKQGMMQQLLTGKIRLTKPKSVEATDTFKRVTA